MMLKIAFFIKSYLIKKQTFYVIMDLYYNGRNDIFVY